MEFSDVKNISIKYILLLIIQNNTNPEKYTPTLQNPRHNQAVLCLARSADFMANHKILGMGYFPGVLLTALKICKQRI